MDWLATDVPASRVLEVTPKQNPIVEKDPA
jgi:peptide/nickel transport system permease protein